MSIINIQNGIIQVKLVQVFRPGNKDEAVYQQYRQSKHLSICQSLGIHTVNAPDGRTVHFRKRSQGCLCPKKIKESVADCLIKIKKAKSNPKLSPDLFANRTNDYLGRCWTRKLASLSKSGHSYVNIPAMPLLTTHRHDMYLIVIKDEACDGYGGRLPQAATSLLEKKLRC